MFSLKSSRTVSSQEVENTWRRVEPTREGGSAIHWCMREVGFEKEVPKSTKCIKKWSINPKSSSM